MTKELEKFDWWEAPKKKPAAPAQDAIVIGYVSNYGFTELTSPFGCTGGVVYLHSNTPVFKLSGFSKIAIHRADIIGDDTDRNDGWLAPGTRIPMTMCSLDKFKTTDYCAACNSSPESGEHVLNTCSYTPPDEALKRMLAEWRLHTNYHVAKCPL